MQVLGYGSLRCVMVDLPGKYVERLAILLHARMRRFCCLRCREVKIASIIARNEIR